MNPYLIATLITLLNMGFTIKYVNDRLNAINKNIKLTNECLNDARHAFEEAKVESDRCRESTHRVAQIIQEWENENIKETI